MQQRIKQKYQVNARLSPKEFEQIEELVEMGFYLNTADFVRDSVRDKLEGIKVIEVRDVDVRTAEREIIRYLENRKGQTVYPSDLANNLGLELETVFKVLEKLGSKGKIEELA